MNATPAYQTDLDHGVAALRKGDVPAAVEALTRAARVENAGPEVWLTLARAQQRAGATDEALAAIDRSLALQPRSIPALILKGDMLNAVGDTRSSVTFHQAALRMVERGGAPPEWDPELARVRAAVAASARVFADHIRAGVAAAGFDPARSSPRFARSLDLVTGEGRIHRQEPRYYFFPGLADIPFRDRADFAWMEVLEARTDAIRSELAAALGQGDDFAPYVEARANRPNHGQAGMMGNPDWGALYLWKDGVEQPENTARFPLTMAALADVDMTRIEGRTPSILFSRLKAGACIPPHTGLVNTRLICHLPLIVPPGCSFRVGDETRKWREGEAWAFDDTIEHEAWNDSDRDRVILIFDVWKPEITEEEKGLITALFRSIDAYGDAERWDA